MWWESCTSVRFPTLVHVSPQVAGKAAVFASRMLIRTYAGAFAMPQQLYQSGQEEAGPSTRGRARAFFISLRLTVCSLTSRVKSAATFCLHFLGNTQQCVFRRERRRAN